MSRPTTADEAFVAALNALSTDSLVLPDRLDRVFRNAYRVLAPTHVVARRTHGRAAVEDATQNVLREFLQKLRAGAVDPERAPGLLKVMLWRRLRDEQRRIARLRFGDLDLDRGP